MKKVVCIQDNGCDKVGRVKILPTLIANHVIKLGLYEEVIEKVEVKDENKEVKTTKKAKKNEKV